MSLKGNENRAFEKGAKNATPMSPAVNASSSPCDAEAPKRNAMTTQNERDPRSSRKAMKAVAKARAPATSRLCVSPRCPSISLGRTSNARVA